MGNKSQKTRTTPKQFPQFFCKNRTTLLAMAGAREQVRWRDPVSYGPHASPKKEPKKRVESLSFSIAAVKNGEATHAITPKQSNLTEKLHTNTTQTRFFLKETKQGQNSPYSKLLFMSSSLSFVIPFFFSSLQMLWVVLLELSLIHLYLWGSSTSTITAFVSHSLFKFTVARFGHCFFSFLLLLLLLFGFPNSLIVFIYFLGVVLYSCLCVIARREQKDETKSYWIRILSKKKFRFRKTYLE